MSDIVFLAPVRDPDTPTTVYGAGHSGPFTDEAQVAAWQRQGRIGYLGAVSRIPRTTALGTTTATVAWTVDAPCTSTEVEYGTDTDYGASVAGDPATGAGPVTAGLTGLTAATPYHYRIKTVTGDYTSYSVDRTFTTAAA